MRFLCNHLASLILQIEKTLSENKDKLPIAEVNNVEKALKEAKKVLKEKENDVEALQKASDDLMQASYKVAEILYKDKGNQGGTPGADTGNGDNNSDKNADSPRRSPDEGGPIDADFEEKK